MCAEGPSVYVSVGSNISPDRHIIAAADLLRGRVDILETSTLYRTPPVGPPGQPRFVNGVWRLGTDLAPLELRTALRDIEARVGRVRSSDKYAPREIDLDLIIHGEHVIRTGAITLPDPSIFSSPHVAVPLYEIAPDLRLPPGGTPLSSLDVARQARGLESLPSLTQELKGLLHHGYKPRE